MCILCILIKNSLLLQSATHYLSFHQVIIFLLVEDLILLFSRSVVFRSLATAGTVAHQVPLSMRFPNQEYWSRFPFPSPGDLPDPWVEPVSLALRADSCLLSHQRSPENLIYWENYQSITKKCEVYRYCWKTDINRRA